MSPHGSRRRRALPVAALAEADAVEPASTDVRAARCACRGRQCIARGTEVGGADARGGVAQLVGDGAVAGGLTLGERIQPLGKGGKLPGVISLNASAAPSSWPAASPPPDAVSGAAASCCSRPCTAAFWARKSSPTCCRSASAQVQLRCGVGHRRRHARRRPACGARRRRRQALGHRVRRRSPPSSSASAARSEPGRLRLERGHVGGRGAIPSPPSGDDAQRTAKWSPLRPRRACGGRPEPGCCARSTGRPPLRRHGAARRGATCCRRRRTRVPKRARRRSRPAAPALARLARGRSGAAGRHPDADCREHGHGHRRPPREGPPDQPRGERHRRQRRSWPRAARRSPSPPPTPADAASTRREECPTAPVSAGML